MVSLEYARRGTGRQGAATVLRSRGAHPFVKGCAPRSLDSHGVVGRFAGDRDVVRMRLAQTGARDADELRLRAQRLDRLATDVSHAAAQSAYHLIDHIADGSLVRHTSLDALGHQFLRRHLAFLEVAIRAPVLHGRETAHPPDHLEAAALEEERLARTLLCSCEHR